MDSEKILTYSGVLMDPFDPKPEELNLADIAHALSMMTRANGHLRCFYSVAQHCLACAGEARARGYPPMVQLFCLLHDASECYLSDLTRPVKRHFPLYDEAEARLYALICRTFAGRLPTGEEERMVGLVDDCMLYHEFLALRGARILDEEPAMLSVCRFETRPFGEVENAYRKAYEILWESVKEDG